MYARGEDRARPAHTVDEADRAATAERRVKKKDRAHRACTPAMQIDARIYEVRADGQLLTCEPATVLPMAQRYFLF